MKLLYGKPVAEKILARLKSEIFADTEKPGLAAILIGNDRASHLYVNLKEKKACEIGMNFFRYDLSAETSQAEILNLIEKLNHDPRVHGIIVQLPLPAGFETEKIVASLNPAKDADGFHHKNTEKFLQGEDGIWPVFPRAIVRILESSGKPLENKKAVVIANSQEFGKIMCAALGKSGVLAEYILSSAMAVESLKKIKEADIVVSAVGQPGLLQGKMLKDGAIVIDGGIEKVGEQVFGDVDFASMENMSGLITPVPGGVGPVTIACLLENVYLSFKAQQR